MKQIFCAVLFCIGCLLSNVTQATIVSLPDEISLFKGSGSFNALKIEGLSSPLAAYDIDIKYDPGFVSITAGYFQSKYFPDINSNKLGDPDFRAFTTSIKSNMTFTQTIPGGSQSLTSVKAVDANTINLTQVSLLSGTDLKSLQPANNFTLAYLLINGVNLTDSLDKFLTIKVNELSDALGNSLKSTATTKGGHYTVKVPEIDTESGTIPVGLLMGILMLLSERHRLRRQ
jgi:hypothetical protein